jgi:hypothetical protein
MLLRAVVDVRCDACEMVCPAGHTYCGGCGATLLSATPVAVTAIPRGDRRRPRLLMFSGAVFVASAITATAAFIAIQANGASGIAMDIGAPIANSLLHQAGFDGISAPTAHGGASWLLVVTFLLAFVVAGLSLLVVVAAGLWRLTHRDGGLRSPIDRQAVVEQATEAGRRHAAAAVRRGSEEYAKAKPKLIDGAKRGRQTLNDDVRPRVAAGAGKAAARGRKWIDERRTRPPGDA